METRKNKYIVTDIKYPLNESATRRLPKKVDILSRRSLNESQLRRVIKERFNVAPKSFVYEVERTTPSVRSVARRVNERVSRLRARRLAESAERRRTSSVLTPARRRQLQEAIRRARRRRMMRESAMRRRHF